MQALKDNFFYSTSRIGADGVFEDDRHVLVEEQKSCRARARCFSLETNRRRKVLEERRKQWDVQEQRLRDNILQQRKQRVQDATERFQRAHLPPSQRRRQSFRTSTLNIEEALNHIQGTLTLSSYTRQSSTPNRSCTSSPKPPPTPSPSLHQRTLSAVEAYSKLMQDRTLSSFKNRLLFPNQLQDAQLRDRDQLQDTQLRDRDRERDELQDTQPRDRDRERDQLQDTQPRDRDRERDELQDTQLRDREMDRVFLNLLQDTQLRDRETCSSPQHHNVNEVTESESLSSLDSLEMEDTTQRVQKHPNGPSTDLSFCPPTKSFLSGNLLLQQGKADASPQPPRPRQTEESVEDFNSRLHQLSQATGWQSCTAHSSSQSNTVTQSPLLSVSHHSLLTLSGIIDTSSIRPYNGDPDERESNLRGDHRVSAVAACSEASTPDKTQLEFTSCLTPEGKLEFRQQVRNQEDKYSKHPSATQVLLPGKTCSHKDLLCEAPSSNPDHILSYNTKSSSGAREDSATVQPTGSTHHQSHRNKPSGEDATNNLNKGSNSEPKAGRSKNTDPLSQTLGHCNIRSDFPKGLKSLQVEGTPTHRTDTPPPPPPAAAVSTATGHPKGTDVRSIKGILKKQSKYGVSGGNASCSMYNTGRLIFTKQFTMSIRDSVELTRTKVKDAEGNKTVNKKIRWFDEVNLEGEEEMNRNLMEQNPITNNKCVSGCPLPPHKQQSASSDHQQGQDQTVATTTPPLASTGYHFTKQAWADVRVQESRLQGHQEAREVRVQESRLQGHQEAREVRVQRGSSGRTGCPRVPRRVRSARAGMDPVSSRSRKGTVIRPQSATEASSHVARVTHGKVMVPRPPPRTETIEPNTHKGEAAEPYNMDHSDTAKTPYNMDQSNDTTKTPYSMDHSDTTKTPYNMDHADTTKTPYNMDHSNDTTKTPYNMDHSNDTTKTPYNMDKSNSAATKAGLPVEQALCNKDTLDSFAPSQTCTHVIRADSGVVSNPSKATPMSGQQDAQGGAARRGLLYHEKGLCLDRTPTDEEISQLWHGVRSALATKDGRSVVRRQPQESSGGGARRRGTPGSGNRRLPLPSQSQATVLITALHSKHDLAHQHQEYAEAEAHSEGVMADSDIVAAKETAQTQRLEPGGGHNQHQGQWITTSQGQGYQQQAAWEGQHQVQVSTITTISLEEQKVLLSLDRLNHRLQYVQAFVGGNPAAKAFLHGEAPFTEEGTAAAPHRKHRPVSTSNRSRTQRRF
ncbi:centrosomal protein of 126 kDa isoform X2 [Coregonus clupeaformis]|uniref:centrosomal protein of 126 kDa isoform X2 n=1 Tax=Coregonus clupeaformis TaxID=59861 RepID=UPI001BE0B258|nr:centrosomal protein of 126 kDa isoform X2 [Coregonus clupeaformis]